MITCGSRFCTAAETRYHPIDGELLGVTWKLEKTGYYTLGSEKLIVLVDHKPLLGLLTTSNLGNIQNPRLLHLAERLLRWTFKIEHIPGASNFAPDALSRSPPKAKHKGRKFRGPTRVLVRTSSALRPSLTQSQPRINSTRTHLKVKF